VLVVASNKGGNWDIYLVQPGTGETKNLTDHKARDIDPVWSPDGRRIAFVSDREGVPDIWTMAADGTDVRQLTKKQGSCSALKWSPDGSRIAFVSSAPRDNIHTVEVATGKVVQITTDPAAARQPAWSPDGKKLSYASYFGQYSTFTVNPDGTGNAKLTDGSGGLDAAWSPDGSRVAYTVYLYGQKPGFHLFTVNSDGKGKKQLPASPNTFGNVFPQWSPDGTKIAFGELVNGLVQVAVVNADGGDVKVLTKGDGVAHEYIRWSPDGKSLSYLRTYRSPQKKDTPIALLVSDADGANAKELLTHVGGTGEWKPK
jgi:TolB protein